MDGREEQKDGGDCDGGGAGSGGRGRRVIGKVA